MLLLSCHLNIWITYRFISTFVISVGVMTALHYAISVPDLTYLLKNPPPPPHVILQLLQTTSSESFLKGRSEDNRCSWKHYASLCNTGMNRTSCQHPKKVCQMPPVIHVTSALNAVHGVLSETWAVLTEGQLADCLESMFCSACSFKRPYSALSLNSTYVC